MTEWHTIMKSKVYDFAQVYDHVYDPSGKYTILTEIIRSFLESIRSFAKSK